MHESEKWKGSHSVVSDSSRPHGLQPTRLLHLLPIERWCQSGSTTPHPLQPKVNATKEWTITRCQSIPAAYRQDQTCTLPPPLPRSMGQWTSYFLIHATSPLDKWVQLRRPVFPHWLKLQFGIPSLPKHLPSSPSLSCSPQWPRAVPTLDFTFVHMISHQWITLLSLHWSLRTWDLHRKSRPRSPRLHFPHCLLSEHTQENFRALSLSLYESFTNSTINRGEENQIRWGCQGAGWTTHVLKESSHL